MSEGKKGKEILYEEESYRIRAYVYHLIYTITFGFLVTLLFEPFCLKYVTGSGFRFSEINHVYAAAALSIVPIMAIYFLASKKIIAGLINGTIKE
jgi:ABC-type glycerol-3-phosphate transport system permease component